VDGEECGSYWSKKNYYSLLIYVFELVYTFIWSCSNSKQVNQDVQTIIGCHYSEDEATWKRKGDLMTNFFDLLSFFESRGQD
jgi:hypothetical protein